MGRLIKFEPRYLPEILQDAVGFALITMPEITDWNYGARVRSILEGVATEQDEEYKQMIAISLLMDLDNVFGKDLDSAFSKENTPRLRSLPAIGEVTVSDDNLASSFLASTSAVADPTITLTSSRPLPVSGFPYVIRIGEGTTNVEDVNVTGNDPATGVLTIDAGTPLTKTHNRNNRVSLVAGTSLVAGVGTRVRVRPATDQPTELTGTLLEPATILPGNYDSNPALVAMDLPGVFGNIPAGAIREFSGTAPFSGARVRNDAAFGGGRSAEDDNPYRDRGRKKRISQAKSTPIALVTLPVGFEYLDAKGIQWRVLSASAREVFHQNCDDMVWLYIWPGNFDFVEEEAAPANEVLTASSEDGRTWFQLSKYPVVPSSILVEHQRAGSAVWIPLVQGTGYFLNEGTGKLEFSGGLSKGDGLRVVRYNYYTGLLAQVQDFINGILGNRLQWPGVRPFGVKTLVTYPRPLRLKPIRAAISVTEGKEAEVVPLVENAITRYITSLRVGEDLILSELIERCMGVTRMYDIKFMYPTANIPVQEDMIIDQENLDLIVS